MSVIVLLILVIFLSLIFTYTNGFQDGSSVAASPIACRAMTSVQAVLLCASFEFLGAIFGGSQVSNTISSICGWPNEPGLLPVLASGLFAAIIWNFVTKQIGIPSSSTHALVGGICGAMLGANGGRYMVWGNANVFHATGIFKIAFSLFLSPLFGFLAGYLLLRLAYLLLSKCTTKINEPLKKCQWLIVPILAFAHGANDTQKAMGVIVLALAASGVSSSVGIPTWVRIISGLAMSFGVISLAPSIVKRVGTGIYKLRPVHGFVSELASASVVLTGSLTGGPVSASQVVASTIIGLGTAERRKGVHWLIAKDMLLAWFFTIPCAALLACLVHITMFRYWTIFPTVLHKSF